MCDFEDWPIIGRYTMQGALDDGVLVPLITHKGKPVVATSHIAEQVENYDLIKLFNEFLQWDKKVRPALPEEEQLFHTEFEENTVWIVEDEAGYTIMYPEDY
jgi:hypothetical protein